MRKILFLIVFCFFASFQESQAQCRIKYDNYHLVFEENFDNISSVDQLAPRWQFRHDDTGSGWGNRTIGGVEYDGEYYDKSQVSIQPGGFLRLTAQKLSTPFSTYSTFAQRWRTPKYKSGMIQLRSDLLNDARFDIINAMSGFSYGMFEIRVKLPNTVECFPAFWLIRAGYRTEIDIFEYIEDTRVLHNVIHDWGNPSSIQPGVDHYACGGYFKKEGGETLGESFHTITCVWTPTRTTFFFDGRETRTTTFDQSANYGDPSLNIIVNLAMTPLFNINSTYMDVDYIKVYKPNNGNYSLPYKNTHETIAHDIFKESGASEATMLSYRVNDNPNSIAVNSGNFQEVFYRGWNNFIYQAKKGAGTWNVSRILNSLATVKVNGDIRYLPVHDLVLFVGTDNELNYLKRGTGSSFTQGKMIQMPSCSNCFGAQVSNTPGSLQITTTGDIFYKGTDNKLHWFFYKNNIWNHKIIGSYTDPATFVKGDIVIDENGANERTVFYKGSDDKIQNYKITTSALFETVFHSWIDKTNQVGNKLVNEDPGSIVWAEDLNSILYIATDKKLHVYSQSGFSWNYQLIPHTYHPNGNDFFKGSIDWHNGEKCISYVGRDGRMQAFIKDNFSGVWNHYWIDDFWNTTYFMSYQSPVSPLQSNTKFSSNRFANEGTLYYAMANGNLAYFKYEPCEVLNPTCNERVGILLKGERKVALNSSAQKLKIYPNPAIKFVTVEVEGATTNLQVMFIDAFGKIVIEKQMVNGDKINVSGLPAGMYIVRVKTDQNTISSKVAIY